MFGEVKKSFASCFLKSGFVAQTVILMCNLQTLSVYPTRTVYFTCWKAIMQCYILSVKQAWSVLKL